MKLNIGSGERTLPGYLNIDRKSGGEAYPLSVGGKPIEPRTCDEIRASHVLEHFGFHDTIHVLRHWAERLKPGGVLKVAVPNLDYIVKAYTNGDETPHPIESYLMGGHTDADDRHGAIFNAEKLTTLLQLAGLADIQPWTSEIGDCASLPVSLNLQGRKRVEGSPNVDPTKALDGLHVVMTAPRLGFTDQTNCLLETVSKLKVPVRVAQGVFWDASLTRLFEAAIADGAEYILTVDYDSLFKPEQIVALHALMQQNHDVDAIAPIQMGRDRDSTLMTIRKADGSGNLGEIGRAAFEAELTPISTCHFGLTIIRTSSLGRLPKPWLHAQPDRNGGWDDGRVDSDIYFWQQAQRAGWKVCQANRVVIGHMQLMATWPDQNLAPIHQYIGQYRTSGAPAEIWT